MRKWALLLLLITGPLCSRIIETDTLHDVPLDTNATIFIDIDDTLIRYPSHLGSTQWFDEQWALTDNDPAKIAEFHRLAGLLGQKLPVVPVEPGNDQIIALWQSQNIQVIGITTRQRIHPGIDDWIGKTYEQVESVNIHLPFILFTNYAPKGSYILSQNPQSVILIDDRLRDLQEAEATCTAANIPFLGIHYTAITPHKKGYSAQAAELELHHLLMASH